MGPIVQAELVRQALDYLEHIDTELTFESRELRDEVAKQLTAKFRTDHDYQHLLVRKSSIRNQLLDPRYTFEGRNLPDKGLGNEHRFYSGLYTLKVVHNAVIS